MKKGTPGDFNTDMLKRDDPNTVKITSFIKKHSLKQLIDGITRLNRRGVSCIDLIMTDSSFIHESSILNDFISDHYTIYSIRKKKKKRNMTL